METNTKEQQLTVQVTKLTNTLLLVQQELAKHLNPPKYRMGQRINYNFGYCYVRGTIIEQIPAYHTTIRDNITCNWVYKLMNKKGIIFTI